MNRRHFIHLPLAAPFMAAGAMDQQPLKRGFKVAAGSDHYQEELKIMGGRFDLKVSAKDTGGSLCIYDTVRYSKGGPALHLHHQQDEWFYVMKGEFLVKCGDDSFTLGPGDSAFAPRGIAHAFANLTDGEARMLVAFQPAGTMEEFFLQMSRIARGIPNQEQEAQIKTLWAAHGMQLVGPPLKF